MKKIYLLNILLAILCIAFFSCTVTKKGATVEVDHVRKSGFIMAKPLLSEIEVENRKIEGRAVVKNKLYKLSKNGPEAAAINLATIDAVEKGDCDIIIQPVVEIENNGRYTNAIVSGFAGHYKSFREITPEDTAAFNIRAKLDNTTAVLNRNTNTEIEAKKSNKKKLRGLKIGAVVIGGVLIAGLLVSSMQTTSGY